MSKTPKVVLPRWTRTALLIVDAILIVALVVILIINIWNRASSAEDSRTIDSMMLLTWVVVAIPFGVATFFMYWAADMGTLDFAPKREPWTPTSPVDLDK